MRKEICIIIRINITLFILYIISITWVFAQSKQTPITPAQAKELSGYKVSGKGFIENKGQITDQNHQPNSSVKYLYCSPGFNVQLRQTGFSYDTYTDTPDDTTNTQTIPDGKKSQKKFTRHIQRVDIELLDCNKKAQITAEGRSQTYYNYLTSYVSKGCVTRVHCYNQVDYKDIYPNIDLEFFIPEKQQNNIPVEYQFIVHPGGNPDDIKLDYEGANKIAMNGDKLVESVDVGDFTENIPTSYLKSNGQAVNVRYTTLADNIFTFSLPTNIALNSDLIIDPTPNLSWGTYYGGSGDDEAYGIIVDDSNNIYITGLTSSSSDIATSGRYQTTFGGTYDVFVAKFNSSGTSLLWGTYYGGTGDDEGYGITLDASHNIYVTGFTSSSSGIATSGEYKTTYGGGYDAFVAKFNSSGTSLLWGTYYGGTGFDYGAGIALDVSNNVYVTGYTTSSSGIATSGEHQTSIGGGNDAFIAKFNSSGTALDWGTYYGGSGNDDGFGIVLDASDNIYITGTTSSTSDIATSGEYQTSNGGSGDAFVAKFNSSGTSLLWGTYYGGSGDDISYGIALDTSHNIYITGATTSSNFPFTHGAYDTVFGTEGVTIFDEAFIAKFNSSGSSLLYGTYYGKGSCSSGGGPPPIPPSVYAYAIAVDVNGNIYVTGEVDQNQCSVTNMVTSGAYQTTITGGDYCYVAKFDPDLAGSSQLAWGTYYGGTDNDYGYAIALDACDNVYVTGLTNSSNGTSTSGAYQTTFGGYWDAFIGKFNVSPGSAGTITGTTPVCQGQYGVSYSVPAITNATGYVWTLPAGATIASGANTNSITVNFPLSSIGGTISVYGTASCENGTSSSLSVTVSANCVLTINGNGTHRSNVTCNCVPSGH